jgi:hypothetical protein
VAAGGPGGTGKGRIQASHRRHFEGGASRVAALHDFFFQLPAVPGTVGFSSFENLLCQVEFYVIPRDAASQGVPPRRVLLPAPRAPQHALRRELVLRTCTWDPPLAAACSATSPGTLYTYIHACMHECIHAHMHAYIHTHIRTSIHTDIPTDILTDIQTDRHTDRQTDRHAYCMYLLIYICTYIHICV